MNDQTTQAFKNAYEDACVGGIGIVRVSVNGVHMATRRIDPRDFYKWPKRAPILTWTRELCLLALGALCLGSGVIWFFKDTGMPVVIVATACALIAGAWFWRVRP